MFDDITKIINEEEGLEATPERKRLLRAMADVRGNLAAATAQLRFYLLTGDAGDRDRFTAPWEIMKKAQAALTAQQHLLSAEPESGVWKTSPGTSRASCRSATA